MDIKSLLRKYINDNIEKEKIVKRKSVFFEKACYSALDESSISNYINNEKEEETFQTLLFKYIDDRGLKDSDVYNKVNIDRRLFSKIRSDKYYHPSKETIILLGLSLELNENELENLLKSASYSLPKNNEYDLIIRFCFKEKIYDINIINDFLYDYKLKLLNN